MLKNEFTVRKEIEDLILAQRPELKNKKWQTML